jgi:hypothetical protein
VFSGSDGALSSGIPVQGTDGSLYMAFLASIAALETSLIKNQGVPLYCRKNLGVKSDKAAAREGD